MITVVQTSMMSVVYVMEIILHVLIVQVLQTVMHGKVIVVV